MTYENLRDEVKLRLGVDGTSIYDFTTWDSPADSALQRALGEFVVSSRYRWLDRQTVTFTSDTRLQYISATLISEPEFVFIGGSAIMKADMSILRQGPYAIEDAVPSMWGYDTPYQVVFDTNITSAAVAYTNNAVSGWAAHSTITQTTSSGTISSTSLDVVSPQHQRYLIAFCTYTLMYDAVGDTASSQRAKANASNAFEFMRTRAAETSATGWQR